MAGDGWADRVLSLLGYNRNPEKLQLVIRSIFERIKAKGFSVPGVDEVLPVPLFEVLDPTDTTHYLQRVEPSAEGGRRMASALLDILGIVEM